MKKIGIVVQRYGEDVNGGAEYHARVLAKKLAQKYQIEIITTCALTYDDWANHYKTSDNEVDGIHVLRFKTIKKNHKLFRKSRRIVNYDTKFQRFLKKLHIYTIVYKNFKSFFEPTQNECKDWIVNQGPNCPELIDHIKKNNSDYSCFIFFTYLYYPTYFGMQEAGNKSIFIPTAHDEPLFYLKPYRDIFSYPKFIMYNTLSEKILVEKNYPNATMESDIAGVGIEKSFLNEQPKTVDYEYLLYIGRIDENKGCLELIDFFNKTQFQKPIKLIFVGKSYIDENSTENIIFKGFVDEQTKYNLLQHCKALIIPSKYESLSLVTLETMIQKKIVIAHRDCEVIRNHIEQSNAGFLYHDQPSFQQVIDSLFQLSSKEIFAIGEKGHKYVNTNYQWDQILHKFDKAINLIQQHNK